VIINLYKHRSYIWRTALAELRNRYAGSGMGAFWNIVQPLSMILIYTVVFTQVFKRSEMFGVSYPVYLCSALLPWTAFSECLNRGTQSFVHNAIYLRKLPIPEQVFVAQTALATAMSLTISFSLLVVFSVAMGHYPAWRWALVPVPILLLLGMGFGVGLALGTVNAFIRDVGQAVPIVMQIMFWTYPVVYLASNLSKGAQQALKYNPVYPFMESIRDLFILNKMPDWWMWPAMLGWTGLACGVGYMVLRRLRPELRDVL
jgi:ABC-type polysaccharide/polyol phosphate export permease